MKKIKVGIFGLGRGMNFIENFMLNNAEIVAICDQDENLLKEAADKCNQKAAVYRDFDEFINHKGLEAVFLANFFHEHARFAIKALEKNIHVLSECTSNATMAEGVALVRAAEKSQAIYMIAENYPFMKFNLEMRRVFQGQTLGKLLYAEGEYNHPIQPDSPCTLDLRPFEKHWRNYTPRTYYVTHSLGPLKYITGAEPVRVSAMPVCVPDSREDAMFGPDVKDQAAIITCLNNDGSVFRVTGCAGFGAHHNAYRICCDKGQIENVRGTDGKIMLRYNDWNIPEGREEVNFYTPQRDDTQRELIESAGHGGGDFLEVREFLDCIRQNRNPILDVYFATNMASVAILGHRSLMQKGVPYDIPDFRKEEDRILYEQDNATPFYHTDGRTPTIPCAYEP